MFGLTKREQRWKAEQQAAELLAGIVTSTVRASADVAVAQANAETARAHRDEGDAVKLLRRIAEHPENMLDDTLLRRDVRRFLGAPADASEQS